MRLITIGSAGVAADLVPRGYGPSGPNLLADMVSPRGFGPLVILFEGRKYLFLQCFFVLPQAPTVGTSMNGLNYKGRILSRI